MGSEEWVETKNERAEIKMRAENKEGSGRAVSPKPLNTLGAFGEDALPSPQNSADAATIAVAAEFSNERAS